MTAPDPLAEVRAEFAAGLDKRIDAMQAALGRLQHEFRVEDAQALYQAAHALTGTAGSMGADGLAQAAGDLEGLARGWLTRGEAVPEEWRVAAAAVGELDASAREYRATVRAGALRTPAARLAVLGELTSLINAAVDMREIFQGAILKVERVLDFRRASVVLVDESASHYYLHTLYDKVRGGFIPGEAVFPIARGVTGEAIRSGRPIRVDALPGTEGILLQDGTRVSAMIVPLHVGERVIGALNFGHEAPGQYTDEDLDWAVVLGRQIETSLYYSKLLKTIAEQREALARQHAAVRQQRNQLEALIEASDAAIMLVGSDRRVAYANHEMARLLGIPGDAMRGTGLEIVHRFLAGALSDPSALTAQEQGRAGWSSSSSRWPWRTRSSRASRRWRRSRPTRASRSRPSRRRKRCACSACAAASSRWSSIWYRTRSNSPRRADGSRYGGAGTGTASSSKSPTRARGSRPRNCR